MKLIFERWNRFLTEGDDVGQVIKIIKHIEEQTGLDVSHEASSSNFTIKLFKNKKLVGYFRTSTVLPNSFEMKNMPSDCKDAWDSLGKPDLWAIRGAEWFDKELRGKGYGKLLYNALFSYVASLNGVVGPDRCSGGSTSDDAKGVWASLYKKYPSEGPLIDLRKQNIEVTIEPTSSLRDSLIKTGKGACGYMNCKLFVQVVTGISKLSDLPSRSFTSEGELKVGDILKWGTGQHYAIWVGEGEVMEVEEWGGEPRIVALQDLLEQMDPPNIVYSTTKDQLI